MASPDWTNEPWEHPDWYDLHDTEWTAGPAREPEHYRECMLALPPLDQMDHLIDVGAGTGKLALIIAQSYPRLGNVTLIEPNQAKLGLAHQRLRAVLPKATIATLTASLANDDTLPEDTATVVTVGSVLMPTMLSQGGTLHDGMQWLKRAIADLQRMLRTDGWLYDIETLAEPWSRATLADPVRRLTLPELLAALNSAGFAHIEVVYRFRDRVVIRAQKSHA